MSKISERLKSDKPWAILGISRKHYESTKPWKKSNMSRDKFESILILLPHDIVQDIKLHASAEYLTEKLFESIK